MKSWRYHNAARAELLAAARWYEERRDALGEDLVETIERGISTILGAPQAWQVWPGLPPDAPIVRRYVVDRFPFCLPYLVHDDELVILAVAHTSRRPGYWMRRLKTSARTIRPRRKTQSAKRRR